MRIPLMLSLVALSFAPMSFAADTKCDCSDQCMSQCQKGDSKGCKCKACDCAKSGQCSHDKCHKDHKDSSHSH